MSENSGRKGLGLFVVLLLITLALFAAVLYEPGYNEPGSPREARIEEFRQQIGLSEGQSLVWSPHLFSETFTVGTVFPAKGLGHAVTTACKAGDPVQSDLALKLGDGKRYEAKPDLEFGETVELELSAAKAVEFSMTVDKAEVLPAYGDLIRNLTSDPECLAMIANREVTVLYGVFRGDERYALSRTIAGNLSSGRFVDLAGAKLGLGTGAGDNSDFAREDVALIWSLTKVFLEDDRFPTGPNTEAFRLAKARELLRQENNYTDRAEARTELLPLSDADISAVMEVAAAMAENS